MHLDFDLQPMQFSHFFFIFVAFHFYKIEKKTQITSAAYTIWCDFILRISKYLHKLLAGNSFGILAWNNMSRQKSRSKICVISFQNFSKNFWSHKYTYHMWRAHSINIYAKPPLFLVPFSSQTLQWNIFHRYPINFPSKVMCRLCIPNLNCALNFMWLHI